MTGRHRGGDPRLVMWLERVWLLGTTAGLTLLAALVVQHDGDHAVAAPVSAPDTEPPS
ncbi:hypothetical protein ACH4VR_08445 [Streptomyces sp. NPDC020883]|uniref:Uncharacterized protein n=1 Tax=Streptomyces yunnanensis TaxID=156453 RepID=A0A9X8MNQ8_9ACTN|nr:MULTISPECIES: hypothetical protein [Streptomyces]SHL20988.1 hypothetical protein SAMN05216268_103215 [Streptomyces yunnanensis]